MAFEVSVTEDDIAEAIAYGQLELGLIINWLAIQEFDFNRVVDAGLIHSRRQPTQQMIDTWIGMSKACDEVAQALHEIKEKLNAP